MAPECCAVLADAALDALRTDEGTPLISRVVRPREPGDHALLWLEVTALTQLLRESPSRLAEERASMKFGAFAPFAA